jgi:citrate synthase
MEIEEDNACMIELDGEKYLDGDEASNLLGVKMSTLYTYVSRGILRSYKQGIKRQRLYKQAELESLLRLRPSDSPSPISTTRQSTPETSESIKGRTEIPLAEDWVPYM